MLLFVGVRVCLPLSLRVELDKGSYLSTVSKLPGWIAFTKYCDDLALLLLQFN